MKNTKYNSIKIFIILTTIIFNLGSFGFAHAASVNTLVDLVNSARSQEGLTTLTINNQLTEAAETKATDMFKNQYFAHISPNGQTPWDFIKSADYNYNYAGENLSIGYTDDVELHNAWMNSETHRANIMNENYTEIGMAVMHGKYQGSDTTIVVQMFGQPVPVTIVQNNTIDANGSVTSEYNILGESTDSKSVLSNNQSNNIINTGLVIVLSLAMFASFGYLIYRLERNHKLA